MGIAVSIAQDGVLQIPVTALPANVASITLTLDRCTLANPLTWPLALTSAQVDLEVSYDGGLTWAYGGGFTAQGGQFQLADGTLEQACGGTWSYPAAPTHVQGTIQALGGALTTGYTLTPNVAAVVA